MLTPKQLPSPSAEWTGLGDVSDDDLEGNSVV